LIKKEIVKEILIMDALKEMYPNSSNNTLRNMLKNKRILINDEVVYKSNILLTPGNIVTVSDKNKSLLKPLPNKLKILFEDDDIIIIDKPEVLLSVPNDSNKEANILSILRKYLKTEEIYAVHRIDRETSGVMIYAKGEKSREKLDEMFKNHDFKRIYLAVVHGNVKNDQGTLKSRLIELDNFQVVSTTNENEGKIAITHYKVLKRSQKYTLLELTLETGRKHQIRVHLKDFNHPIIGDKRYGKKFLNPISRICLHAHILEFIHPFTNEKMTFTSPMPSRFSKVI
jgi:23S rRNA pseudouridine1911/1915/1917 synthase